MIPQEILFGSMYSDQSGWEWAVSLKRGQERKVEIEGVGGSVWLSVETVNIRDVAKALNEIADILGED